MASRAIINGWPLVSPSKAYAAPSFSVAPTISGAAVSGSTLTVSYTAAGWPTPTAAIQWRRDNGDIPGATASSYLSTDADIGRNVSAHVRLTNAAGYTAVASASVLVAKSGVLFDIPKWTAAKAARAAGTRNARCLILGDSTTWGQGAGGVLNGGNGRAFSWPTQLAGLITAGAWQSFFGNGSGTSTNYYPAMDSRDVPGSWTLGGASAKSIGAFPYTASTALTRAWTPTTAFDTIELYYAKFSGGGTFTVNVDGGATLATVNTNNASNALGVVTINCSLGLHTINATWASGGAVTVFGAIVYNSAAKETTIINGGVSGSAVADHIIATSPWSPLNMITALAPDLVIVDLTINDTTLGTAIATYQAGLQSIIDKTKPNSDLLFVTGNPIDPVSTGASQALQQSYVDAFKGVAATNSINAVDIFALFKDYTTANAKGWMYDNKHPPALGYTQIANAVFSFL